MTKDPHIDETLEKLTELAQGYQRALECSNEIISIKNRYIELCEMETAMYKKQVKRLTRSLTICGVIFAILTVINIIRIIL